MKRLPFSLATNYIYDANTTGLKTRCTIKIHSIIKSDFSDGSRMKIGISLDALRHCGLSICLNQRANIS